MRAFLECDRILKCAGALADVALDPALGEPVHVARVRARVGPAVQHRQRLHHSPEAEPVFTRRALQAPQEEDPHLPLRVVIAVDFENWVFVVGRQQAGRQDGGKPQRVGRRFRLRRRLSRRHRRTHFRRLSERHGRQRQRRRLVVLGVVLAAVRVVARVLRLTPRPEHDDVFVAPVRTLVQVARRRAIETSGAPEAVGDAPTQVKAVVVAEMRRTVRAVVDKLDGVVVGRQTADPVSLPAAVAAAAVVGLVDVGVVVAETDVPGQPGQLTVAPILHDVVGELAEDDKQEDDLEDDEDGHVVGFRVDRTHGVVVERNQVRSLEIG